MKDLEIAKKHLREEQLTLAIVKNGQLIYRTDSRRISGFIKAIDTIGAELKGASVADKVVGKALALLCVYAGVRQVYAEVLSLKAQAIFEEYNVAFEGEQLVENVLDLNKAGVCPFEKAASLMSDPKESCAVFKTMLEKMKPCK